MKWKTFFYYLSLLHALQMTIAMSLSFILGELLAEKYQLGSPLIAGLWSGISAAVVSDSNIAYTYKAALKRFVGSLYGSVVAGLFSTLFGYDFWVLLLSFFTVIVLISISQLHFAVGLAAATVLVIIAVGPSQTNLAPWLNATTRFLESALGILIAIFFSWLFHPIRKRLIN